MVKWSFMVNLEAKSTGLSIAKLDYSSLKRVQLPNRSDEFVGSVMWADVPYDTSTWVALAHYLKAGPGGELVKGRNVKAGTVMDVGVLSIPSEDARLVLSPIVHRDTGRLGVSPVLRNAYEGGIIQQANYLLALGRAYRNNLKFGAGITVSYDSPSHILPEAFEGVGVFFDPIIKLAAIFTTEQETLFKFLSNLATYAYLTLNLNLSALDNVPTRQLGSAD